MSDYKVQANATIGGVLFNVNGDDVPEVMTHLKALATESNQVFDLFSSVEQAARVSSVLKTPESKTETKTTPTNASEPPPWDGDVKKCDCGVPMNDVRGQVYKSGAKEGQPYPADFYAGKDCKNKCKPVKL